MFGASRDSLCGNLSAFGGDVARVLHAAQTGSVGEAQVYRSVLAELPKGVTIVTTMGDSEPVGSTASAVTSLSLEPPLVLLSLGRNSRTLGHLRRHGQFAINVLRDRHRALAESFAAVPSHEDRFATVPYRVAHDVPVLGDALAWVTCRLHATYPGGDHLIVVGAVTGMHRDKGEPLLWHRGAYRTIGGQSAYSDGHTSVRPDSIRNATPGARPGGHLPGAPPR
jgi:3-hydroxy-9,10-secoandrosta-1,3,5(10)-triene-9,17-dione monooxygenase reductase component